MKTRFNYTAWERIGFGGCLRGYGINRKQVKYYTKKYNGKLKKRKIYDVDLDVREIEFNGEGRMDSIIIHCELL